VVKTPLVWTERLEIEQMANFVRKWPFSFFSMHSVCFTILTVRWAIVIPLITIEMDIDGSLEMELAVNCRESH
jgi:hypothetical protein